MGRVEVMISI